MSIYFKFSTTVLQYWYNFTIFYQGTYLFQKSEFIIERMKKGLSPLIATVMLIAITLGVSALLGSWFTSITKTQTEIIEEIATKQINCTGALLSIVDIVCSSTDQQLRVAISNLGDIEMYNFSILAKVNNTFYDNKTGGPSITDPLNPGEQAILTYYCSNTLYCVGNATLENLRVSPMNCPGAWTMSSSTKTCS
jgi:flagellin-like protein